MAGDWMKIEKVTTRKPEILRIADQLGIHRLHAFGLCVEFWSWCDDQLRESYANGVTEKFVDDIVGHKGFASALLSVDWLQARSGSLEIPNFDRHLAEGAKTRALTAKRMKNSRAKQRHQSDDGSVTPASPEKRREESNSSPPYAGDGFMTSPNEDFLEWWACLPEGMKSGQRACWEIWPETIVSIQETKKFTEPESIKHLIQRTKLFANSDRGKTAKYRWKPITFLQEGHYDDSVQSWEMTDDSTTRRSSKRTASKHTKSSEINDALGDLFGTSGGVEAPAAT